MAIEISVSNDFLSTSVESYDDKHFQLPPIRCEHVCAAS